MYVFFDTETTGLPSDWKAPVTALDNWPRMVQIAWLVYDSQGNRLEERDYIIRPDGYTIPADVSRIHGITNERAINEGTELRPVLEELQSRILRAAHLVAHNMSFDEKIVGAEFLRMNMPNNIPGRDRICTMTGSTDYCAIEGPYGYKWPKLTELYKRLFNITLQETHNALADINATAECFWKMRSLGIL